jgi:hypothetical protein
LPAYPQSRINLEDAQALILSRSFLESVKNTVDDTAWAEIAALVESQAAPGKILKVIRFAQYNPVPPLEVTYRLSLNMATKYVSDVLGGHLDIAVRADLLSMNPKALDWLEKFGADEVKYISESQREAIRNILVKGYGDESYSRMAWQIKNYIGLDPGRAEALQQYGSDLMAEGVADKAVWQLVEVRGEQMLKDRADTIALNETIKASAEGTRATFQEAQDRGILSEDYVREWNVIGDERLCEECSSYEGMTAAMGDQYENGFDGPPVHVNCRCFEKLIKT